MPAYSDKASRRPLVDFNKKFSLPGETPDATGATAPDCRHLSAAYRNSEKKADFFAKVADPSALRQAFGGQLVALEKQELSRARDTDVKHQHIVAGDQFGAYLAAVAGQLRQATEKGASGKQEGAHAEISLETANHAMSAQVQHKTRTRTTQAGDTVVEHYYSVSVYDPNVTNNHKRITVDTPAELASLDFASFLSEPALCAHTYGACEPAELQLHAVCQQVDLQTPPLAFTAMGDEIDTPALTRQMSVAIYRGLAAAIEVLGERLAGRSDAEKLAVLQAKRPDGVPTLHTALQDGHADAMRAFGKALQQAGLPAAACAKLMAATNANGEEGLFMALQHGHGDAVAAFGDVLKALDLPPSEQAALLAARRRSDGTPGVNFAMQAGNAEAVKAFGAAVNAAPLTAAQKLDLLVARRDDGVVGVSMALQGGRTEAMQAFGEAMRELCASIDDPQQKAQFKTQAQQVITTSPHFAEMLHRLRQTGQHDVVTALDDAMKSILAA